MYQTMPESSKTNPLVKASKASSSSTEKVKTGAKHKHDEQFVTKYTIPRGKKEISNVSVVHKTKPSGAYSIYVHKLFLGSEHPYIMAIEAIAADFYNFIYPGITPKVRVITTEQEGQRVPSAVISKQIRSYKVARTFTKEERSHLVKTKIRQLAALFCQHKSA